MNQIKNLLLNFKIFFFSKRFVVLSLNMLIFFYLFYHKIDIKLSIFNNVIINNYIPIVLLMVYLLVSLFVNVLIFKKSVFLTISNIVYKNTLKIFISLNCFCLLMMFYEVLYFNFSHETISLFYNCLKITRIYSLEEKRVIFENFCTINKFNFDFVEFCTNNHYDTNFINKISINELLVLTQNYNKLLSNPVYFFYYQPHIVISKVFEFMGNNKIFTAILLLGLSYVIGSQIKVIWNTFMHHNQHINDAQITLRTLINQNQWTNEQIAFLAQRVNDLHLVDENINNKILMLAVLLRTPGYANEPQATLTNYLVNVFQFENAHAVIDPYNG